MIVMVIVPCLQIPDFFTHTLLVDRMAGMMNYFLASLVGPKQRTYKVREQEEGRVRGRHSGWGIKG